MRSGVHNSDFINRRKALERIWGEFSCSRILDKFVRSPNNFRFQAFEAASASNMMKEHYSLYQQKKSYYGDVTTTGWKSAITKRNSPVLAVTASCLFPHKCELPHQWPRMLHQKRYSASSPHNCNCHTDSAAPCWEALTGPEMEVFSCFFEEINFFGLKWGGG